MRDARARRGQRDDPGPCIAGNVLGGVFGPSGGHLHRPFADRHLEHQRGRQFAGEGGAYLAGTSRQNPFGNDLQRMFLGMLRHRGEGTEQDRAAVAERRLEPRSCDDNAVQGRDGDTRGAPIGREAHPARSGGSVDQDRARVPRQRSGNDGDVPGARGHADVRDHHLVQQPVEFGSLADNEFAHPGRGRTRINPRASTRARTRAGTRGRWRAGTRTGAAHATRR